jgi:hypothetical protein
MNGDFIFWEQDWLYSRYRHLEFVRSQKYPTFKAALNLFLQNGGQTIVETGTMRVPNDPGGCSTLLFGAFCKRYGKKLYTVDINPMNVKVSMDETKEFKDSITYVVSDSVKFLSKFKEPIDLLYLDSLDCPVEGDATQAQEHQLNEIKAAYDKLHVGSIYLGDDSNFPNGGKTRMAKQFLLRSGEWHCILDSGQTLWQKVR